MTDADKELAVSVLKKYTNNARAPKIWQEALDVQEYKQNNGSFFVWISTDLRQSKCLKIQYLNKQTPKLIFFGSFVITV